MIVLVLWKTDKIQWEDTLLCVYVGDIKWKGVVFKMNLLKSNNKCKNDQCNVPLPPRYAYELCKTCRKAGFGSCKRKGASMGWKPKRGRYAHLKDVGKDYAHLDDEKNIKVKMKMTTDFGKREENTNNIDLSSMTKIEIASLEGKEINILDAFTQTSKKYPDSKYAVLVMKDETFVMGGSVIAGQIDEFKKDEAPFPASAMICKRVSKKNGKEYFVLG